MVWRCSGWYLMVWCGSRFSFGCLRVVFVILLRSIVPSVLPPSWIQLSLNKMCLNILMFLPREINYLFINLFISFMNKPMNNKFLLFSIRYRLLYRTAS